MDAAAIDIIRLQQVLQIRRRDTIPVKIAVDPELVDIEIRDHAEQRDRDRALRLQKVCCPCREGCVKIIASGFVAMMRFFILRLKERDSIFCENCPKRLICESL